MYAGRGEDSARLFGGNGERLLSFQQSLLRGSSFGFSRKTSSFSATCFVVFNLVSFTDYLLTYSRQEVRRSRGGRVVAGRDPVHAGVGLAALRRLHAAGAARASAARQVQVGPSSGEHRYLPGPREPRQGATKGTDGVFSQ